MLSAAQSTEATPTSCLYWSWGEAQVAAEWFPVVCWGQPLVISSYRWWLSYNPRCPPVLKLRVAGKVICWCSSFLGLGGLPYSHSREVSLLAVCAQGQVDNSSSADLNHPSVLCAKGLLSFWNFTRLVPWAIRVWGVRLFMTFIFCFMNPQSGDIGERKKERRPCLSMTHLWPKQWNFRSHGKGSLALRRVH